MAEKKKRKQWKDNDMRSAMSAVNNKEMTIYAAAASFNVPRKTLDDRIKGLERHGTNPGPSTALTFEQENALESYLFYMAVDSDYGQSLWMGNCKKIRQWGSF